MSIHDELGAICDGCLPFHTELSIPAASDVSTPGNPFYDGTVVNPYSWTLNAKYQGGFQLDGLVHLDDDNVLHDVPACATIVPSGAPTAAIPLCWDTLVQVNNKKLLSATGRGLENGKLGFP